MSNFSTAIVTDSTCDVPEALIEKYQIIVVPQVIIWDGEKLRDRVDLSSEEFYRRLANSEEIPSSSLPTVSEFEAAYRQALESGARSIVTLTVSGAMSGTFQVAQQAGDLIDEPVYVVDSRGPTMSLGWQVLAAARARELKDRPETLLAAAERVRSRLALYVSLDTIDYLHKGGRIGNAAWLVGRAFGIKPLVRINHTTGLVEAAGRARTTRRALDLAYTKFFEEIGDRGPLHVAVLHGDNRQGAEELAERIRREHNPEELIINITGPVLGTHTGPAALALCGYREPE